VTVFVSDNIFQTRRLLVLQSAMVDRGTIAASICGSSMYAEPPEPNVLPASFTRHGRMIFAHNSECPIGSE
jgi:hypothetical protein